MAKPPPPAVWLAGGVLVPHEIGVDHASMSLDPRALEQLREAGFTPEELRALAGDLYYAAVLGEAGEVANFPMGEQVEWTPAKMEAFREFAERFAGEK